MSGCTIRERHCECCGETENICRPDDPYSACCYKAIVTAADCRGGDHDD